MKKFLWLLLFPLVVFGQVAPPTAVLTWTVPTTNTDGTPITGTITYTVYQGTSASSLTQVATGITATTDTISTGLVDGTTYYWAVSVQVGGVSSAQSNVVSKTMAAGIPNTVVLTVK
jgi:hypothetical protein